MARKFDADEVLQQLLDDHFGISDEDSSDEEYFYDVGKQDFNASELAALSSELWSRFW